MATANEIQKRVRSKYEEEAMMESPKQREFEKELVSLINRYSEENDSNTPDFILGDFLLGCLANFNSTVNRREQWYGRKEQ